MRLDPRRSYVDATNEALARAGGEAVMLLNADCFLAPGFLAAARPRLEEHGVGSVAPKLIRAVGPRTDERLDALDAAGMVVDRRRKNTLVGHGRPALAYDRPAEVFGVDGAAALYRRELLEDCAVDGRVLDEDFERWASDVDLAWRARLLGWRCVYEPPRSPGLPCRYYSPSTRGSMPERDRRMQFRNRYLMIAKNDTPRAPARPAAAGRATRSPALGYALVAERRLLGGYRDAARLLAGARCAGGARCAPRARATEARPPVPLGLEVAA